MTDTIARAPCQGFSQFNGKSACGWCEHPTKSIGKVRKYPFIGYEKKMKKRNQKKTIRYLKIAVKSRKPYKGVKRPSPLVLLRHFDIINSFTPDYMHNMLLGVGKRITEVILKTLPESEIKYLSKLMKHIKVPHQIARLARPLKKRHIWKAKEWESFIL